MRTWARFPAARPGSWARAVVVVAGLFIGGSGSIAAQNLRDPTLPPAQAGRADALVTGNSLGIEPGSVAIIVRDGRPFLVVGTRLYGQGSRLGRARIERISETEVWLREGKVLHKVTPFAGIERRAAKPTTKHSTQ